MRDVGTGVPFFLTAGKKELCLLLSPKHHTMQTLYPFKFSPIFKEKIWGGQKIRQQLKMDIGLLPNCGEAWLLSGVEGNPTLVTNGYLTSNELNELVEVFMGDLVGDKVYERFGDQFPILVKVIDSNDWLSIQVHPDDELAKKRGSGYGKTEMWYVMQADENAELICGFNQEVDELVYMSYLENKKLREIMNFEQVEKGNVFFIPAGRVHALGPGTLIAEIQQTSDTTYRIYDWDRVDDQGNSRELHTEEALEAIDYTLHSHYKTPYRLVENSAETLVQSPFFTTNILKLTAALHKDYSALDSFVILFCTEGSCRVDWEDQSYELTAGEVLLLPNVIEEVNLIPDPESVLLEVYIE
mgnify:CR=1 FL=1